MNDENLGKEVDLEQKYAVISIPADAIELFLKAKIVLDNGETTNVETRYTFKEIRDAIKEAEDGYIPRDAVFSLTRKGKELCRQLNLDEQGVTETEIEDW